MRRAALLGVTLAAACGTRSAPEPAAAARALADAPPAGSDDVVVARVDGHPVWGSCVTAQATRTHGDRAAALRDCVDFELLAWRAAAYATAPEVGDAIQTAMVARVVDRYEATTPAELEPTYDTIVKRALPRVRHPAYRGSSYVRVVVDPIAAGQGQAPTGDGKALADADAHAHAVAAQIAAALATQTGLSSADLLPIAQPIADAGHVTLTHDDQGPTLAAGLVKPYADALYAIPEVGRTAGPVRTPWGWDIILYSVDIPPHEGSDGELAEAVIPAARRVHFPLWVSAIARGLGVQVSLGSDAELARALDEAP